MKKILISLMHFMIVFTIVHAPIVLQYPVTDYGVAYAQDEPTTGDIPDSGEVTGEDTHIECGEGNDPENDIYRPGCAFKNEHSKIKELNADIWDVLLNLLFSLALISMLLYNRAPRDIRDCPGNVASNTFYGTPRVAQIAALVHIISEFTTNAKFREIAKSAVDYEFVSETDENFEKGKQLSAFVALESIYKQQMDVAKQKQTFAIVLEAAYLGIEGYELGNLLSCKAQCIGTNTILETIKAVPAALTAAAAAPPDNKVVDGNASCQAPVQSANAYIIALIALIETGGATKFGEDAAKIAAADSKLFDAAIALPNLSSGFPLIDFGFDLVYGTLAETKAAANSIIVKKAIAAETAITAALSAAGCTNSLGVWTPFISTLNVPIQCCGGDGETESVWGSNVRPGGSPKAPGTFAINYDISFLWSKVTKNSGSLKQYIKRVVRSPSDEINDFIELFNRKHHENEIKYLLSNYTNEPNIFEQIASLPAAKEVMSYVEQGNFLPIIEKVIYNYLFEKELQKINSFKDPHKSMVSLAKGLKELDFKMHNERMMMAMSSNSKQLESINERIEELGPEENAVDYFKKIITQLNSNILSANAGIDTGEGPWGELIGVGAGAVLGALTFIKSFAMKAMDTPKLRVSFIWTSMIALQTIVLTRRVLAHDEAENRYKIVKEQKSKFEEAMEIKTGFTGASADPRNAVSYDNVKYEKQALQSQNSTLCTKIGSDGAFMPARCPSSVAPGSFNATSGLNRIKGNIDPSHLSGLSTLATTAQEVGTTGTITPSTLAGANLEAVKQNNAAMRKANEKLRKKADSLMSKVKGKGKGPMGYSDLNKRIFSTFRKRANALLPGGTASSLAALSKEISKDLKKNLKKEGKGEGQMRAGFAPKVDAETPEFDFNMDDPEVDINDEMNLGLQDEKGKEKDLKNFIIKHNDINKNKGVSIFKILSNRYILSYPKIIPEKKKAKLDLPKSKSEQGQSQAPSKTLEDQLKNLKKK